MLDFTESLIRRDLLVRSKLNQQHLIDYKNIIAHTSKIMMDKHSDLFSTVGIDINDLENYTGLFVMYYKSLYSLHVHKPTWDRTMKKIQQVNGEGFVPDTKLLEKIENSYMVNFIRGLYIKFVGSCYKSAKNMTLSEFKTGYFKSKNVFEKIENDTTENEMISMGYEKIKESEYKDIKKNKDGYVFRKMFVDKINDEEYVNMIHDDVNLHYRSPEDIIIEKMSHKKTSKDRFNEMETKSKEKLIKQFVNENKKVRNKEEVLLARKMLRDGNMRL